MTLHLITNEEVLTNEASAEDLAQCKSCNATMRPYRTTEEEYPETVPAWGDNQCRVYDYTACGKDAAGRFISIQRVDYLTSVRAGIEAERRRGEAPAEGTRTGRNEGPQLAMFYKNHRGTDLYNTYSAGGWEAGNLHRVVDHGALIEGPHAWMSANPTVVTAHKQTPRERIVVTTEDTLILRGTEYAISQDRYGYLKLTPVKVPATV